MVGSSYLHLPWANFTAWGRRPLSIRFGEFDSTTPEACPQVPAAAPCWDTGHGHRQSVSQTAGIGTLGSRLKATHIQDNDGVSDQHILPYQGTINWNEVVRALKSIGYEGDFTYETHNSIRNLPDGIRDSGLKYAHDLGSYIISL